MARFFVVFATFLVAFASAQQQKLSLDADLETAEAHHSGHYGDNKKYSSIAELSSLAHSSAQQARNAVRSQQTASLQASLGAQNGFVSAAQQAANTARTAVAANQVIVQHLDRQLGDAEHQLQEERGQYEQALEAAQVAQQAAQQSQEQLGAAAAALATIQQSVGQIQRAAEAANAVAANQHEMIQEAEQRVQHLHERLAEARAELNASEESARRAQEAAELARSQSAAQAQLAAASASAADNQIDEHESGDYHHH